MGLLALSLGCASHSQTKTQGDPLIGEIYPKGQGPTPQTTPNGPPGFAPSKTSSIAPPSSPTQSLTPAALATTTLPGGRPLAITPKNFDPVPGTLTSSTQIKTPEPLVVPIPKDTTTTGLQPTASWNGGPPSQNDIIAQLGKRGVLFQKQDNVPEGVRLTVVVPHPQQPGVTRVYEATAPDYPAAVQAILLQIDQSR